MRIRQEFFLLFFLHVGLTNYVDPKCLNIRRLLFQASGCHVFFFCPYDRLLSENLRHTWVARFLVFHRPPSASNQRHYDGLRGLPHPQAARAGERVPRTSARDHRSPSALSFIEPPPASPEHAQARAETFQRILKSSPRQEMCVRFQWS